MNADAEERSNRRSSAFIGGLIGCGSLRCDMSGQVRTTVRLDDSLLDQAKREAARRGQTLTSLIDQGLRLVLARGRGTARRVRLPVCRVGGGTVAGVDLSDTSALLDLMEGRR